MAVSLKFPPAESDVYTGQHQSTAQRLISIEISNAAERQGTAVGVSHYRNLDRCVEHTEHPSKWLSSRRKWQ